MNMQIIVASYRYIEEGEIPVAKIDRLEPGDGGKPKSFRPYLAIPKGGYAAKPGIDGRILPLYRLPELLEAARNGGTIFFTEGEGKADKLRAALKKAKLRAAVSTCAFGKGGDKHFAPHLKAFTGAAKVIVLADSSDKKGGRAAAQRRVQLIADAHPQIEVRVLDLFPERDDDADVADWLEEGHDVHELHDLVAAAPIITAQPIATASPTPPKPPETEPMEGDARPDDQEAVPPPNEADPDQSTPDEDDDTGQGPQWSDDGPFPMLPSPALYGIIGSIVRAVLPHTEAAVAPMLLQGLTLFGVLASSDDNYFRVGAARHWGNLFSAVIGPTSSGRKGQSLSDIAEFFRVGVPEDFALAVIRDPASGEALVARVADEYEDGKLVKKHKRMIVVATEFSSIFAASERKGSTLSAKLRQAYDGCIANETKENPMTATQAVIGQIGHMTPNELHEVCKARDITNGLANRNLWCCSRQSKELSSGGNLSAETISRWAIQLATRIVTARKLGQMRRSEKAEVVWDRLYKRLGSEARNEEGLLGDILARTRPNLLRLAVSYAHSDAFQTIEVRHLRAAWYLLRHCIASARHIFGARLSAPKSTQLLAAARDAFLKGNGLNGKEQNKATGGRGTKEARENLLGRGLIRVIVAPTPKRGGNPPVTIFAVPADLGNGYKNDIEQVADDADADLFAVTDAEATEFFTAREVREKLEESADFARDADSTHDSTSAGLANVAEDAELDREVIRP